MHRCLFFSIQREPDLEFGGIYEAKVVEIRYVLSY